MLNTTLWIPFTEMISFRDPCMHLFVDIFASLLVSQDGVSLKQKLTLGCLKHIIIITSNAECLSLALGYFMSHSILLGISHIVHCHVMRTPPNVFSWIALFFFFSWQLIIIKRISRAPFYHTRWQHRALLGVNQNLQNKLSSQAGLM